MKTFDSDPDTWLDVYFIPDWSKQIKNRDITV